SVKDRGNYREAINDTNEWLVNFFRVLKDEVKSYELARRVLLTPYSRSEYGLTKTIMKNDFNSADEVEAAWAFFVNIRVSFAAKLFSGWGFSVYGVNHAISNSPSIDLLPFAARLRGVYVDNLDALSFIKNWDSPQTFFFCDPPYPETEQGHYSGYTKEDFRNLCETLDKSSGSFILTCYPFDGIEQMLPKGAEIFKFRRFASSQKKGNKEHLKKDSQEEIDSCYREEWIVRRMAKVEPRDEIKKLYAIGAYDCFTGEKFRAGPNGEVLKVT
ncbi:MAG: DNA adenine methylase, partial [Candidatus Bathyarchaeia archaeon]